MERLLKFPNKVEQRDIDILKLKEEHLIMDSKMNKSLFGCSNIQTDTMFLEKPLLTSATYYTYMFPTVKLGSLFFFKLVEAVSVFF